VTCFDDTPNDLPPDHEADVSTPEADALDARLNEISQSQGRATAWFRRGPQRRSRIREAADVPDFAQAFHQRVERQEAADAGFAALDPTLWEQIMASTTSPGLTPSRPALTANPSAIPQAARISTRATSPRRFLTGFTNATLAVIVLLMAFGAWRIYDGERPVPPPTPDQPHSLAFQPEATPETIAAVPEDISTPEPAFACDFTRDIPILLEVNESPVDATIVLLTRSGDVILTCPEEPEPIVLASDMGNVAPTQWPGVVMTQAMNYEVGVTPLTYINLLTGEQVEIVPTYSQPSHMAWTGGRSQWALQVSGTEETGDVSVVDLKTFDTRLLSDLYMPFAYPDDLATVTSTNSSGVLALALSTRTDPETGIGAIYQSADGPGTILIVNGSLSYTRWIHVPNDLIDIQEMVLSPDGDFLALRSTSGMDGSAGSLSTIFSVIRTDTGAEVGRSDVSHAIPDMRWAMDGDALVFLEDSGVGFIRTDTGEIERLLETNDELQDLRSTHDPETVLVTAFQVEDPIRETPTTVNHRVLSLNIQTGEMLVFDGIDISLNASPGYSDSQFLVMAAERPAGSGPHSFRVVDPVSGEEISTLENVEYVAVSSSGQPTLDVRQVATTPNGATQVISFSPEHSYVLHQGNGSEIAHLPTPDMDAVRALALTLSSDGKWLSAIPMGQGDDQLRYLLDLTEQEAEWQRVPDDFPDTLARSIFFVPGTGD
jgi:hypothetical protein